MKATQNAYALFLKVDFAANVGEELAILGNLILN